MSRDAFQEWAEAYRREAATGTELAWPSETLVRLFKGAYVPGMDGDFEGKSVLEVGVGNGNNLAMLGTLGLKTSGTEVTGGICAAATERLSRAGFDTDIRVGTNREIPFDDGSFDYLVSWNVLHYEDSEDKIMQALAEYRRVLKDGGRFFISTTGPEHKILDGAEIVGAHLHRIQRDDDFRKGQVFFYFDSPGYIEYYFGRDFRDVKVGRVHDDLMNGVLDWWIVTGVR